MGRGEKFLVGFLGFGILVFLFAISHGGDPPALPSEDHSNLDTDTSPADTNTSPARPAADARAVSRTGSDASAVRSVVDTRTVSQTGSDVSAVLSLVDTRAVSQTEVSLGSYGLKAETAAHWKLPGRLREISGLAMTRDGRLLAHNDERGIVYEIDYRDGSIAKAFQLADTATPVAGDFEGIAAAGEQIYLVTSSGRLYECTEGDDRESVLFNAYATGVGRDCEIEGLAYDGSRRALLLMCKGARSADLEGKVAIYPLVGRPEAAEQRIPVPKSLSLSSPAISGEGSSSPPESSGTLPRGTTSSWPRVSAPSPRSPPTGRSWPSGSFPPSGIARWRASLSRETTP